MHDDGVWSYQLQEKQRPYIEETSNDGKYDQVLENCEQTLLE